MEADRPLAEWAYVTPRFPEGLRETDFQRATPDIQSETAEVWFLSNHRPAAQPGRGGYGTPALAYDVAGAWGSESITFPINLLRDEFGTATDIAFTGLIKHLRKISDFWELIPTSELPSDEVRDPGLYTLETLKNDLDVRLNRLEISIQEIGRARGKIGDNQGPPLLNDMQQAAALAAIAEARDAIAHVDIKKPEEAKSALNGLRELAKALGVAVMLGLAKEFGKDLYHALPDLQLAAFHHAQAAVLGLEQWIRLLGH
jgi:hypothetical protein